MISHLTQRPLLALIALLPLSLGAPGAVASDQSDSLYIDYSVQPNPTHLLAHDINIVSPEAQIDFDAGHRLGNRFLAYLSLVEIAEDASYREAARKAIGSSSKIANENWNSEVVDISSPAWQAFVLNDLARPAVTRGFDGFFLDTADSLSLLVARQPERAEELRNALIKLIASLKREFPEKSIVINRGFDLLPDLGSEIIDGVLVESVFRSFDPGTEDYLAVSPETTRALVQQIETVRAGGYPVHVVDYVQPGDDAIIAETEEAIRQLGATPFITTPRLDGTLSAGGQVARRILVLFGHDPAEAETHRIWPADTTTYAILQMPLEYMGYEVDYHDVSRGVPPGNLGRDYAGVILDEEINLPYHLEHEFANWIIDQADARKKLLFLGSYAFNDHHEQQRIFQRLGISGDQEIELPLGMPEIVTIDESVINFEATVAASRRDFENLSAPSDARVLLSLEADYLSPTPETGPTPRGRYDTTYLASWGGALLAPYVVFEASEETVLQFVDPFAFLDEIFPAGIFPAPDPTTRDGLRVFYTHVDGDGFSSLSAVEPGQTCAEVLHDQLLKDLPWPITISIVEAEIRGHILSQAPGLSDRLVKIARQIYELPQVEAASHSYSHPYLWIDDDDEFMGLYDSRNLSLKLTAQYPKIEVKRETTDSLSFVSEFLTPAEKSAELLLWSGNCRPSPEALRELRSQGYENMNGGNTILCNRFPGLFGVAPRTISWDGELQINAANQNEFMYTNGWMGPTWGGFSQVIETFEMTESPRRLKPVNVYYHFYSAERHDAFAALNEIYDWCRQQPLHGITGLQYARSARDSWATRLVRTGHRRWIAVNEGHLRTFRIPATLGVPDLARSEGITGFRQEGENLYLHTNGSRQVTVQLADAPEAHVRLETATAAIEIDHLRPSEIAFRVLRRPAEVVLGGFSPGTRLEIKRGNSLETEEADAKGRLQIQSPSATSLSVKVVSR